MKIYIARHGETKWNAEGRMQGWKNSNLTEKGIANAKKLGQSLKHVDFDLVCCSPLGRAVETASHILSGRKVVVVYNSAFKEMSFGSWEGRLHDEVAEQYPEQQHNLWNAPHLYQPIDGESYEALIQRVKTGLDSLIESSSCNNILLVTHAAVIKALLTAIDNRPLQDFWGPPFAYDTCLAILEAENNQIKVLQEPDISHLKLTMPIELFTCAL